MTPEEKQEFFKRLLEKAECEGEPERLIELFSRAFNAGYDDGWDACRDGVNRVLNSL